MTKLSPSAAKRIVIGKVGGPHGIAGDMRVIPLTDFPERFAKLKKVMVGDELLQVTSVRYHKQFVLLRFAEYPLREEAMALTGKLLTVSREDIPSLAEGEYYTFDIIGLEVFDPTGQRLGVVQNVLRTGSNDVYEVKKPDGCDLLVPALKKVVKEINIPEGRMVVDMPEEISDAH